MVYREMIRDGTVPTNEILSQVFGCLQLPHDASMKDNLIENLGVIAETSKRSNLCSLIDGFGEYDPRAFSLLEVSMKLKFLVPLIFLLLNILNGTWTIACCCINFVGSCFSWNCSICVF